MKLGSVCSDCQQGRYRCVRTITKGTSRQRYLRCDHCRKTSKESLRVDAATGRVVEASFFSVAVSTDRK
jgi:hypothetical protein